VTWRRWLAGPRAWSSRRVADYYDRWTDRYEAAFGDTFQSQRTADLAELFGHIAETAELRAGARVLDAGCGVGGPAVWLARHRGVAVEGVNVSPVQVERARRRVEREGLGDRVRILEGDFHRLDALYPPAAFDAVLFLESLVHSEHPERVLAGAARVLRPGGVLYVKDLFRRRDVPWRERLRVRGVVARVDRACCLTAQSTRRIVAAVERAPLELLFLRPLPLPTEHDLGNAFVAAHGLDIYRGEPVTFLDWLELKARRARSPLA
jgi:ubiquinone/menaquinone biosynthesis C-methylase UbiE